MKKCRHNKTLLQSKNSCGFDCPYHKEDGSCKWPIMGCYYDGLLKWWCRDIRYDLFFDQQVKLITERRKKKDDES